MEAGTDFGSGNGTVQAEPVQQPALVRVRCTIPEASHLINDTWWGKVGEVRISEPIPSVKAKRFTGIAGFTLHDATDEEAEAADLDIQKSQRTESPGLSASQDAKDALKGMAASNERLSAELYATHRRLAAVEEDNMKLRRQLARFGVNAAQIGEQVSEAEESAMLYAPKNDAPIS